MMKLVIYRDMVDKPRVGLTALSKKNSIDVFPIIFRSRKRIFIDVPSVLGISEIKLSKIKFLNIIHIEPSQIMRIISEIDYEDFKKVCDKFDYG